jgi:hypothetical protein
MVATLKCLPSSCPMSDSGGFRREVVALAALIALQGVALVITSGRLTHHPLSQVVPIAPSDQCVSTACGSGQVRQHTDSTKRPSVSVPPAVAGRWQQVPDREFSLSPN